MGIGAEPLDDSGRPIIGWDATNHRPAVPQITSTSVDPDGVVYGTLTVNATVTPSANQRVNAQSGDFVDGAIATLGSQSDTSATSDTGTFSLIALFKRALTKLTSIVTNTSNIPAQGQAAMAASLPVALASNQSAIPANIQAQGTALNADGSGNLKVAQQGNVTEANSASISTNTSNTSTVLGATTDAAVTGDSAGTISAKQRGLTKILADVWDSVNHLFHFNLKQVGGNAIAVGNNAVPILTSAATGYVSAYGSNAAATTATTDYSFKWGAGGTTQVNHIMLQNNTGANIQWDLDTAANAGSPILATGQTLFLDVQTTALHLYTAGAQNVNGSTAGNIVVRGWL